MKLQRPFCLRMYSHLATEFLPRKTMRNPKAPSRTRRVLLGLLALWGGGMIVTSGPRSVEGLANPADPTPERPAEATLVDELANAEDRPEVLWQVLAGLDYMSGEVSEELQQFVGKEVKIPGFMVPLEDFAENVSEFLLVPYVGACVHTPPPPPNQLVYVTMNGDEQVQVTYWDPIWIHGTLEIEETTNMYGQVSFSVSGIEVQPYEW